MQNIDCMESLKLAIIELEHRHNEEGRLLKEHLLHTYESMKPINIIKNTFKEAAGSKELKDNIINTALALAMGFIYNIVVEKVTNTPLKKILSTALMSAMAAVVEKNSDSLKSFGGDLLKMFKKKSTEGKKNDEDEEPNV